MSSNSVSDWFLMFKKKFAYNPFWRSIAEVVSTVFFTFGPFLLLSIPFTPQAGELTQNAVRANFWEYWIGGELVLPILGLSGALISLTALNGRALNGLMNFFSWIIAFGFAVASGFVLAETEGFSVDIHEPVIWVGFIGYTIMLLFWGFVSFRVHVFNLTAEVDRQNPEERADKLNRQKAAVEQGGAQ